MKLPAGLARQPPPSANSRRKLQTKINMYEACVRSTLLYSCEARTTYKHQERRFNTFHQRCLRKILGIKCQDKVTNTRVLELTGLPLIKTMLCKRRLKWLGHVHRMDNYRLTKQLLLGELSSGRRPVGRPKLRFKNTCKESMPNMSIDPTSWELLASDRSVRRQVAASGASALEVKLRT